MAKKKPRKLPANELLRLACRYAINDQLAYIEAIKDVEYMRDALEETIEFVRQLREYSKKRWPIQRKLEKDELVFSKDSPHYEVKDRREV